MRCWHFMGRFLCKILQHKKWTRSCNDQNRAIWLEKMSKKEENKITHTHTQRAERTIDYINNHTNWPKDSNRKPFSHLENMTSKQDESEFEWKSSQNALGRASFPWSIYFIGCELCLCVCSPHTCTCGKDEFWTHGIRNIRHLYFQEQVMHRSDTMLGCLHTASGVLGGVVLLGVPKGSINTSGQTDKDHNSAWQTELCKGTSSFFYIILFVSF